MDNSLILEVPINRKDAKRRGIDESLCRLLLYLDEGIDDYHLFAAKLIELNKPTNDEICIVPYGAFKELSELNIQEEDYSYDSQLHYCIVRNIESLSTILKEWEAEGLVFFYCNEKICADLIDKIRSSEPKILELSKSGYEIPFLKQVDICELFLFYSMSRSAFELIGNKISIMNFFEKIKNLL